MNIKLLYPVAAHVSKRTLAFWISLVVLLLGSPPTVRGQLDLILTCHPAKTVECGEDWSFEPPTASGECVYDALVYDNSIHDLELRFNSGLSEVGDEIVLEGSAREASRFVFEYWGTNRNQAEFAGAVQARVRFYANDGPAFNGYPTPATVLYDSGAFSVATTLRATLIIEDFTADAAVPLTQALPESFTWTVQFTGLAPDDAAGVDLFSPPVVGQAFPDFWERTDLGWILKTNAEAAVDFAARLEAASGKVTVAVVNTVTNFSCGETLTATRTWQATDTCGHLAECSQSVTVVDTIAPSLSCAPDQTVPPGVEWSFQAPVASDLCGAVSVVILSTVTNIQVTGISFSRTWRATDACGNANTCSQVVTMPGLTVPAIAVPPADQLVEVGGTAWFTVTATGTAPRYYQWFFNGTEPIAAATNATLTLANLQPEQAGSYHVLVRNAGGSTVSAPAILRLLTLPEAVDALELVFQPGGNAAWIPQTNVTHDGMDAARSGVITDNQNTRLETYVEGPGTVSYWWKVSSEPDNDQLRFYVGAEEQTRITGEVDWQFRSYPVPAGQTLLKWRYSKNGSRASGQDAGWVDQVTYVPDCPMIIRQPVSRTVDVGATVTLEVAAVAAPPLSYQWLLNGLTLSNDDRLSGVTSNRLTISNVLPADVGDYTVVVSNACSAVASSPALLTVVVPAPRRVRVSCSSEQPLTASVWLEATGDENALGFSLNYDPTLLRDPAVALGNDAAGASLLTNNEQSSAGHLGLVLALPAGSVFAVGTNELMIITFALVDSVTNNVAVPLLLTSEPVALETVDMEANSLLTAYEDGCVTIRFEGYEADVAPRPNGNNDGTVTVADWVQMGRFVAAMDTPAPGSEFQRSDCAPRATLGNGALSVADWVQAGRYAAALDPVTPAGGPEAPALPASPTPGFVGTVASSIATGGRSVRVLDQTIASGTTDDVTVILTANGDENGLAFTLTFDPAVLQFREAQPGESLAPGTLLVNTNAAALGSVALAAVLPAGMAWPPGDQAIAHLRFFVTRQATPDSRLALGFADVPVAREIVNAHAEPLGAKYHEGLVTVTASPLAGSLRLHQLRSLPDGAIQLLIGRADDTPLDAVAADGIAVYTTTNLALPSSDWTPVDTPPVLTNGWLQIEDRALPPAPMRFYRAVEKP